MVVKAEFLRAEDGARTGNAWLHPCIEGANIAGLRARHHKAYEGESEWLALYGIGDRRYSAARAAHMAKGLPVACWDMGYFGKSRDLSRSHVRVAIDADHVSLKHLDRTPADHARWTRLGIGMHELFDARGPVVVVGMGIKSREHLGVFDWEEKALKAAVERFPGRRVIYRAKPSAHGEDTVAWEDRSEAGPINGVLKGASLVICKHSNVAIDACIAGVPVECEAGAPFWLYRSGPAPKLSQRLDFLYRLAWWNWQLSQREMEQALRFLIKMQGA